MKNNEDKSYKRYKQYRINRYRYEQEQIIFPIVVMAILAAIIGFWKQIVIAIVAACAIAVFLAFLYLYLKKQVTGIQPIVLTAEQAKDGVEATVNISYKKSKATVSLEIPPKVKDGEKFVIKNVVFEDAEGKKTKKTVRLKVEIS